MATFQEIWQVFSTGKGRIYELDAISLSVVFRIAEMEYDGDLRSQSMRRDFLENESINSKQLNEIVREIKKNTILDGTVVYNSDGQPRYRNLPDVGFIATENGPQTVILTKDGIEAAD